ncbi:amino acid/polyamine/organocation transporter (APC superfamily) [Tamaricihabitans halophyticus]|uniref:Amino acid/polyamine/organocation transporter (APC superfamily) n=1 Tax=Tamaricihabitans halophyticus TaxID=1262583 RepID=A0A4R2R3V5_9PSEU|nr:APC family permease [Tamaricihabitans halophyticus]TCP56409.1 amino acid/polyamine/organocation transporter (APC superfamily) [Tamaricihabitans halophyticus]
MGRQDDLSGVREPGNGLIRVLGRTDVLVIAFGAMIGFGWVVLTGDFLGEAGSIGAALAFLFGGIVVGLVGLTYAELVSAMPAAGGEHNYVLRGLGSRPAFVASWALVLGYVTVAAFEAVALPQTISYLVPSLSSGELWTVGDSPVYAAWTAVGVAGAIGVTVLNYVGVRPAAVFQTIGVAFLLGVGALLVFGSVTGSTAANFEPLFTNGFSGILVVLVATPFLFVGFDVIPQSAGEIKVPYRKMGTLLVVSVGMATAWYILIMLTVGGGLSREDLAASPLPTADSMAALWNSQLMGNILVLGGIAGIMTSWNGFMIGASRLLYAMAGSGMLPRWFARVHPKFGTPGNAVLFIGFLSMLAPLFGEEMLGWLVNAGSFSIIVAYLLVALTFLVLRRREPEMPRPFRVGPAKTVGILAVVLSFGLAILFLPGMPAELVWPYEWIMVGLWVIAGLLLLLRIPRVRPGIDAEHRLLASYRGGSGAA